jgi:hypothetical protein
MSRTDLEKHLRSSIFTTPTAHPEFTAPRLDLKRAEPD